MGFFSGSSKKPGSRGNAPKKPSPRAILQEACDRNIPVCVVRPREAGRVPMARGRLLKLGDDGIDIDRVQVPGRELYFSRGDELQAFFSMGKTLYQFRTTLQRLCEPKQLNARMVIPGMTLSIPGSIEQGDRRNVFRVGVSARDDRPAVSLWRLPVQDMCVEDDDDGDEIMPAMPAAAFNMHGIDWSSAMDRLDGPPDHFGWVADATDSGLGIRLEGVTAGRFSIFDPVIVRVELPESIAREAGEDPSSASLTLLAEVRSKRAVGDDGSRIGIVLMEDCDPKGMPKKRNLLRRYLAAVQRDQLRNNKDRAA